MHILQYTLYFPPLILNFFWNGYIVTLHSQQGVNWQWIYKIGRLLIKMKQLQKMSTWFINWYLIYTYHCAFLFHLNLLLLLCWLSLQLMYYTLFSVFNNKYGFLVEVKKSDVSIIVIQNNPFFLFRNLYQISKSTI